MSIHASSVADVRRALALRDLTDPSEGPHALQTLVTLAVEALETGLGTRARIVRQSPIVSVADNYDRLGYAPEAVSRDARYSRYVCEAALLRTHTSAMIPSALRELARGPVDDVVLVCPGIVYRRDSVDRNHTGEPHQLDLWRIRAGDALVRDDLLAMIAALVAALLPGWKHRVSETEHPYTLGGLQIDVSRGGPWLEIGECGLAHPRVLSDAGLDVSRTTGLALGLGLDRLLLSRKNIPDIRLLRAEDPRISGQMLDLAPYEPVSCMPPIRRDLSLAVANESDAESLGDRVRRALGARASAVESVELLSETPYDELPESALERMGLRPGQKNVLVKVVLRDLERTLTHDEANTLRDEIYAALHEGERHEWAGQR
ncbi:MAG: hypothetical protein U0263_34300 [Polyangiaceae bacterium]